MKGGAEAAIHAMKKIFQHESTEAVILVDASNAFNSLNRQAALHNIRITCPPFATILINTYRQPTRMIVLGGNKIMSAEGTTKGDNLAMSFYALGTTPLQKTLKIVSPQVKQVWLGDDATGAGTIAHLRTWWDTIISQGTKIGYHVNESKSWIIVKNEENMDAAKEMFMGTNIKFTTEGKRQLGATIGSENFRTVYAIEKVQEWCEEVKKLSKYAKTQPQAAFAAFCHGEQHRFSYFMRTIPGMEKFMEPLDETIHNIFLPSLLDSIITGDERLLFSLPIRLGGLSIPKFTEEAECTKHQRQ